MTTIFGIPANVVYATAGVYALLIVASAIVWMMSRRDETGHYRELKDRVRSWWWMIGAFTLAMLVEPHRRHRLPRLHLLSRAERVSLADPDAAHRPRRAAVRLSRHSPPVLLGGDRLVRHVHRVHSGVDVPVLPGADGAPRRDARLPARRRHALLGPDDDGVHLEPHGDAARLGRRRESGRGRTRAPVLSRHAHPVQRRRAVHLGQAHRPPQGDADGEPEEDLGGADRRHRHHDAARAR